MPLLQSKNAIKDIAEGEGDLTRRLQVKTKDEFGDLAFWTNAFINSLNEIIGKIKDSVSHTATAVDAIHQFSDVLNNSAQNQSSSAEETSAAIEEISSSMSNVLETISLQSKNADDNKNDIQILNDMGQEINNAMQILNSLAMQSTEKAQHSGQSVNLATTAMDAIKQSTLQINQVVNMITDISDQTSLLSLNAAIEAARAGDSGKGFAVVADEISKLADRTVTGVKEITKQINQVNNSVDDGTVKVKEISGEMLGIIESINQMHVHITNVNQSVGKQTNLSYKIRDRAAQVNTMSKEVENAVREQRLSVEEMNKAMMTMAQDAQTLSEQADNLIQKVTILTNNSDQLKNMVDRFKTS